MPLLALGLVPVENQFATPGRHAIPSSLSLCAEKILDDRDDALDLRVGQFGENRQAEAFARGFFGDGKSAGLVAEIRIALLQMQRQRVMQRATDAVGFEVLLQIITARMTHDI